jgi:ferritin-like protein
LTKTDKNPCTNQKGRKQVQTKLPSEIIDTEHFVSLSQRAKYCAVKRLKDVVKLKMRTPSKLYTIKIEPLKAEEIIKKLQCEIREI